MSLDLTPEEAELVARLLRAFRPVLTEQDAPVVEHVLERLS